MAERTSIEWTDSTWTPIKGCSRASEGCRNCYAEIMAARFSQPGQWGEGLATVVDTPQGKDHRWTGKVRLDEKELYKLRNWKKPRKIFVCSTADLFHESVPDRDIDAVFAEIVAHPQHTYQVLTKRAKRMRRYFEELPERQRDWSCHAGLDWTDFPLPNVWLGVSVEDQKRADERIPHLLATPAAVRFLSCEPLLSNLELGCIDPQDGAPSFGADMLDAVKGEGWICDEDGELDRIVPIPRLNWVIAGGESGPSARPMHPDWARSLRDQCAAAGVAFHFKQWGEWADMHHSGIAQDRPVTDQYGNVRDWMNRYVVYDNDAGAARVRGHSFTEHSTNLVYRVGKKAAGRLLDGVEHNGFPA